MFQPLLIYKKSHFSLPARVGKVQGKKKYKKIILQLIMYTFNILGPKHFWDHFNLQFQDYEYYYDLRELFVQRANQIFRNKKY